MYPVFVPESSFFVALAALDHQILAWIEGEYHREVHAGIGVTPLDRLAEGPSVAREAPSLERLRFAFTQEIRRTVRRTDGTVQIDAVRFEIPSRLRTLREVILRYRRWDLSEAWIVDPRTNDILARIDPVDLTRNADRRRKPLAEPAPTSVPVTPDEPLPPRMRELLANFAADGLPPAFLPLDDSPTRAP